MDKDLEKCGCGCEENNGCGCGDHGHDHEHGCGCGGHDHDHECGCGCGDEEAFVVDLEDDNGNIVSCPIIDAFEFEGKEYILAQNPEEDSVYLFRTEGEELVVPEEEEFDRVSTYYQEDLAGQE
ncbi:DUF1292 domain-containing protein [Clostridium weizhouense]|uniref:DUF1292 domain-containing protein n=1 Tax=Clostridium weizhouense TaxID=2859781 RepID=A0ABS7AIZ1_9CLOT|nr:DUF1292 domain-containing protein [Clostridium weizhouense]MBW6408607.1 DUF1292 domain-containing protein [Clostridium weizhouense]